LWYKYTAEYYSAIKNNEIISFTGKWMEVEIMCDAKWVRLKKTNFTCSFSHAESRPKKKKNGMSVKEDTL
jgi:hypothetical protein